MGTRVYPSSIIAQEKRQWLSQENSYRLFQKHEQSNLKAQYGCTSHNDERNLEISTVNVFYAFGGEDRPLEGRQCSPHKPVSKRSRTLIPRRIAAVIHSGATWRT